MDPTLPLNIRRQPDDTTCGPTCLHAIYRYHGDPISLDEVIAQVPQWQQGGTLAVYLANHALRRGYQATIIPFNLTLFDPTWDGLPPDSIAAKLRDQLAFKQERTGFREVTRAYLEYLALGGRLRFAVLTPALIRRYLTRGTPILTGLSATYLYNAAREYETGGQTVVDDVRGQSTGHFVVLWGYRREDRHVLVADPLVPNPLAPDRYYGVDIYRLVCAIMLGVLTYDGNLLIIRRPITSSKPQRPQRVQHRSKRFTHQNPTATGKQVYKAAAQFHRAINTKIPITSNPLDKKGLCSDNDQSPK